MRKVCVVALFMALGCASAIVPPEQREVVDVREFQGMTRGQLFLKIEANIAESFRSANTVVQLKDRANGKIVGQAYGAVPPSCGYFYTFIVDIKDGKVRINHKNFSWKNEPRPYQFCQLSGPIEDGKTWEWLRAEHRNISEHVFDACASRKSDNW